MPILLDDIQNNVVASTTYSPKFFSSALTGSGSATTGLLSKKNNPINIDKNDKTSTDDFPYKKKKTRTGSTETNRIPLNTLPENPYFYGDISNTQPHTANVTKLSDRFSVSMEINAVTLIKTTTVNGVVAPTAAMDKKFIQNYRLCIWENTPDPNVFHLVQAIKTSNPVYEYPILVASQSLTRSEEDALIEYLSTFDVYDAVVERSMQWQTTIAEHFDEALHNLSLTSGIHLAKDAIILVKYLMNYNIPLELYKSIYASLTKYITDTTELRNVCKTNLNLLLSDTMNNLDTHKAQIPTLTPPTPAVPLPASMNKLSREQTNAVKSCEPLILVQAGAGTGKSTLILARIDYLISCGVEPKDITVLSFTNAAADNIKAKNANINSMTIASMIHEIYSNNYTHELSSIDTIINSLDIYFPKTLTSKSIAPTFGKLLKRIKINDTDAFTEMNSFIEDNFDEVMLILDTIGQTSLELEIIICYQQIGTLVEPKTITSKYLIIDEVQDNSIFEFVYALKYVDKHRESLFIVGDCSQTLYEFRASNPRALNILENSGTFATYQLNVNYRSNQEILDFANVALRNIEANQYAQIQLRANSLTPVTEQSFSDKIVLNYKCYKTKTNDSFKSELPYIIGNEMSTWIDDALARGEKVAFLAFTRREVAQVMNILKDKYPDKEIVSLVPEKSFSSTVISNYIKNYWDEVKFLPSANMANIIRQNILGKLDSLTYDPVSAQPYVTKMLDAWRTEQTPTISMWTNQVNNKQMTPHVFLHNLRDNMLSYEIKSNAIRQSLLSARNQENKQNDSVAKADFLLSTIHSAKGLEFDNVCVIYKNDNSMDEDKKRMYYVAFTRAMKTEYILAYDKVASPQILADYVTILTDLHDKAPAQNSVLKDYQAQLGKRTAIKK